MRFPFDNSFAREMTGFYAPTEPEIAPNPKILAFNNVLAVELGIPYEREEGLAGLLSGAELPDGAEPLAFAYAGHQFGHFSPQLGDGRALLLGEIVTPDGRRVDVQLKGSGRTAFSRNGDGKAAIGPVLREYLVSEAMAAMGMRTTRSLAAVATGERVQRERAHPGAVLTRIAASHVRVGTFQYFAAHAGEPQVTQLANYTIDRHYPELTDAPNPALALLEKVIERQADAVARWMGVGFVHGVMNTDNVAVSGEIIDYGPCAFVDRFSVNAVFSSIDRNGRYAYGKQPNILHWNMARFAEALLPAIHARDEAGVEQAKAIVDQVPQIFRRAWERVLRAKLGLVEAREGDGELFEKLFELLEETHSDFTGFFRSLAQWLRGDKSALAPYGGMFWDGWISDWTARLDAEFGREARADRAAAMDGVNPIYIPRNHRIEEALAKAEAGDLSAWEEMLEVVRHPFIEQSEWAAYAEPAPEDAMPYRTFCGT